MTRAADFARNASELYAASARSRANAVRETGNARANAQAQSGQIWGQTIANIGQMVPQLTQDIIRTRAEEREQQKAAQEELQLRKLFSGAEVPSPSKIIGVLGPQRGVPVINAIAALRTDVAGDYDKQQKVLANVFIGMHMLPESVRAEAYPGVRGNLIQRGIITPDDAPEQYDPHWWQQTVSYGQQPADPKDTPVDWVETVDAQGRSVRKAVPRVAGTEVVQPPPTVEPMTPYQEAQIELGRGNLDVRRAEAARAPAAQTAANDGPLVAAVIANPDLWHNLTPTVRQRIAPALADQGFADFGPAPSAMERMDARKFDKAGPVIDSIEELSEKINTQQGVIARISGAAERAAAIANMNDDVAEYQALISGFTPLVARALGHTGVLTEQDVQSVRALFPNPGDSKSLRDRKIARLNTIVGALQAQEGSAPAAEAPAAPAGTPALSYEEYRRRRQGGR